MAHVAARAQDRRRACRRRARRGGVRHIRRPAARRTSCARSGETLGPTQKLSARAAASAPSRSPTNAGGDILAVWDRAGKIEARYWYASSERLSAVKELGTTDAALKLSVSLGDDRRAVVGWIDQRINEGGAAKGSAWATARTATRGFRAPKQLDTYGVNQIAGGVGVEDGAATWSSSRARTPSRPALVNGRSIHTPQAIAPDRARPELRRHRPRRPRHLGRRQGGRRRRREGPHLGRPVRRQRVRRARGRLRARAGAAPAVGRLQRRDRVPRVAVHTDEGRNRAAPAIACRHAQACASGARPAGVSRRPPRRSSSGPRRGSAISC